MKNDQNKYARPDDTVVLAPVAYPSSENPSPLAEHGMLAAADEQGREDGLAAELAKAAPRRWWNRGTLALGGLALILAGFLGGLQVQKHYGTPATAAGGAGGFAGAGRGAGAYGFPGGNGFPGANGAAPGAGATASAAAAGTTGTVKLVNGDTIYVQTAAGDVVTVKTSGSTTVQTATKGTLKDVKAGDSVTVAGATGTDGSVTATSVTAGKKAK